MDGDLDGMTRDELVFTENETNSSRVFGFDDGNRCVKDAFHNFVIRGEVGAVNPLINIDVFKTAATRYGTEAADTQQLLGNLKAAYEALAGVR